MIIANSHRALAQVDAKFLKSEWFFKTASATDIEYLYLLGETFAATANDTSVIHLTEQLPLTTEGFVSTLGATSIYHSLM